LFRRRRDNRPLGGDGCGCRCCFMGELVVVDVGVVRKAENFGMVNGETAAGAVPGWAVMRWWRERKRESGEDDEYDDDGCELVGAA
jgi:hypothetical protein